MASLLASASCQGASDGGQVIAGRYERAVLCDDEACYDEATGALVEDRSIEGFAFLASQDGDDLLVYGEFPLEDGAGYLEIDVQDGEGDVRYVELTGGEESFRSARAVGTLEIPADPLGEECGCITGRFQLRLSDPGGDGELDTSDDLVRHLTTGRYTGGDDYCEPRVAFPALDVLELRRVDRCPVRADRRPGRAESSEPRPSPSSPPSDPVTCDGSASEGCESGGSSGCESDESASCESDGGSSGSCEGDDSATCEGDSSSTCESAAGFRRGGCRAGLGAGLGDGRVQLILFVWLALWIQRRRAQLLHT